MQGRSAGTLLADDLADRDRGVLLAVAGPAAIALLVLVLEDDDVELLVEVVVEVVEVEVDVVEVKSSPVLVYPSEGFTPPIVSYRAFSATSNSLSCWRNSVVLFCNPPLKSAISFDSSDSRSIG